MQILVVTATAAEVGPLVAALGRARVVADAGSRIGRYDGFGHDVDVLVSGVGMVATATWCARALARHQYDFAVNVGVCGAFDRTLPLGSVVHIVSDCFPELGAEDGDAFLTLRQLDLLSPGEPPFREGRLVNDGAPDIPSLRALPKVHGITVNTVHGNERTIANVTERYAPQVESMEGAAFMYACLTQGLPFAQVRSISNFVERRNRAAWKLREAIECLGDTALRILEGR